MSKINSAVVIAKLLATEGFTDFVANEVEKYWRKKSGLTDRQQKSLQLLDIEFTDIMKSLTKAQCLVVGKFIGLHKKMSFDTGLKIGLQAIAQNHAKDVEI